MLAADLDALVGKIVGLFGTAEDQIAGAISSQLSAQLGDGGQDVGSAVLNQLGQQLAGALLEHAGGILGVRTAVESILRSVLGQLGSTLSAAFLGAVEGGADTAVAEASELRRAARHAKHGSHAIMPDAPSATARASKRDKLVQDLIRQFQPQLDRRLRLTHAQVLRSAEDIYRKAVAAGAMAATPGAAGPDQLTRRQATQRTLDDLWQRGISGFVDRRGRQWNLATYVEMATRTALAQASAQAHLDMMGVEGFDLCQVSDSPHECPRCLISGTVVDGPVPVWRTRSHYSGYVLSIVTATGKNLTGTPNHPVLTTAGWRRLDALMPGNQVLSYSSAHRVSSVMPDHIQVPIAIEKAGEAWAPILLTSPTGCYLDRSIAERDIRAVLPDGDLIAEFDSQLDEPLRDLVLISGVSAGPLLAGEGSFALAFSRNRDTASGGMGRIEHVLALLGVGGGPAFGHTCADSCAFELGVFVSGPGHDPNVLRPSLDTGAFQVVAQRAVADAEDGRQLAQGLASLVAPDEVLSVSVSQFSGHVWDLSTTPAWFMANGIVTHNCRPWEGKVLTRDNSGAGGKTLTLDSELDGDPVEVEVAGSVSEAIAAGLLHPNAILGAQPAQVLGEVENAVRAWYDGPSVNLTTSRGHRLTVSPNHPVLTTRGWLRADLIRQGDQVLSGVARRLADKFAITDIALNDMPSTFEDIFQALFAVGRKTSVAATRHDFHGDGRSYKGKVDVVWTEGALLRVVQSGLVEQLGEQFLVRTDVQLSSLAGVSPQGGALWGVSGAIGRALSDLDATCFESAQQGRVTDAEDWRQVLTGLAADVAPDQVVNVDHGWYSGHAYDLQTSTGAYLTDGIIVHNCTHRFITYLAGLTRPLTNTQNAKGYEATQTQRGLEREARRIRVQIKGAVSPSHVKDLKAKLKGQSQAIEDHLAANPTLVRKPERELPNLGHVPSPVDPTKAPVKVAPVSKLKAVQVKKVAAPVKAKKAPVKKAPVKKATVTAPRKPAAKSTLAPKVRPPKSTPPRAVKAAAPTASAFAKRPTFDQPVLSEGELKSVYGPRMTVNRAGKDPARLAVQLRGLGQIDKGLHKRMNGFLGEEQYGGIYLGPKGILDTAPVEMRANFHGQPRGYPAGSTYNDVRGCYVPHEHALLIGDDQHPLDGTHSTAQHEFGHAVDHMEGHPSRSQEYKDVYDSLKSSITFKPYFSATGNPSGYHSESFAEFFNAYASQRGKPEQVMVRVMMGQLGFAPAANDIAYAVIKGPEEIARLPRGAREGLVAMRKLIAMLDDITEGKR